MKLSLGNSHQDGITFSAVHNGQTYVISAKNVDGDILIERNSNSNSIREEKADSRKRIIFLSLAVTIFSVLLKVLLKIENDKQFLLLLTSVMWVAVFFYYSVFGKSAKYEPTRKYHAVEHRIWNYFNKYNALPTRDEELWKMRNLYIMCGNNLVSFFMIFFTLCIVISLFSISIWAKGVLIIASLILDFVLLGFEYLNFFQVCMVQDPDDIHIELGVALMKEFERIQNEV